MSTFAQRADAYDAIAKIIHDYLPTGTPITAQIAFSEIIAIVDKTDAVDDLNQLDLPLAA